MSFTQVPVTGTYALANGSPASGSVTFTPTAPMRNGSSVISERVVVQLVSGTLSTTLAATDKVGTTPSGVSYNVVELVNGVTNRYAIAVPAAGGPINLGTVARAEPSLPALVSKADAAALAAEVARATAAEATRAPLIHTHPAPMMPYPLSGYGLVGASFDLSALSSQANSFTANTLEVTRVWVPAGTSVTGVCVYVSTAGTGAATSGASGFAIYSDAGVLLQQCATDYTLWTATGWRKQVLPAPIAATDTGQWLRVAQIHTCTTAPKVPTQIALGAVLLNSHVQGASHRRQIFVAATSFPASFDPATYGSLDSPTLFIGVY